MEILDLSAPLDTDKAWAPWWARNRVKRQGHRFGALAIFLLTGLSPRFLRRRLGGANDILTLSSHGTTLLERLAGLHQLPATGFTVSCFPLNVKGGSAGPSRVVALMSPNKKRPRHDE